MWKGTVPRRAGPQTTIYTRNRELFSQNLGNSTIKCWHVHWGLKDNLPKDSWLSLSLILPQTLHAIFSLFFLQMKSFIFLVVVLQNGMEHHLAQPHPEDNSTKGVPPAKPVPVSKTLKNAYNLLFTHYVNRNGTLFFSLFSVFSPYCQWLLSLLSAVALTVLCS